MGLYHVLVLEGGDILGHYKGLWDPTDMGLYHVLVLEGRDSYPGTIPRSLGAHGHRTTLCYCTCTS